MAVTVQTDVLILPWQGHADPGLPAGSWFVEMSLTGDGSGGVAALSGVLAQSSTPNPSNRLWSLEDLSIDNSDSVSRSAELEPSGFTLDPSETAVTRTYALLTDNVNQRGATNPGVVAILPLFLGRQANALSPGQVIVNFSTNTTGVVYRAFLAGFFWSVLSRAEPGGPRRPAQNIWGRS